MLKVDDRPIDLGLLTALNVLLETGNVTRAAERLGLSQPAVSRILARLRRDFGDPLLVRAGAGLRRTPRAEALAAPVAALLEQARLLYDLPGFDPARAERRFRVAMPEGAAAILLPRLMPALLEQAPGCRIDLVGAGEAGLDLTLTTEGSLPGGWRAEALWSDVYVLAFGTGLSVTDLSDARTALALPHIAVVPPGGTEDPVDGWLRGKGLERRIAAAAQHPLQAMHLVARSASVAMLPSRLVAMLHKSLGLGRAELPIAQAPARHWMAWPAEQDADAGSVWLRALVRGAAG